MSCKHGWMDATQRSAVYQCAHFSAVYGTNMDSRLKLSCVSRLLGTDYVLIHPLLAQSRLRGMFETVS